MKLLVEVMRAKGSRVPISFKVVAVSFRILYWTLSSRAIVKTGTKESHRISQ